MLALVEGRRPDPLDEHPLPGVLPLAVSSDGLCLLRVVATIYTDIARTTDFSSQADVEVKWTVMIELDLGRVETCRRLRDCHRRQSHFPRGQVQFDRDRSTTSTSAWLG